MSTYNVTVSLAQAIKEACLLRHSESSWCFISCQCHGSHAQMHGDFKGPNPDQKSDLVILFSGSGHAHSVWAFRHSFRHDSRAVKTKIHKIKGFIRSLTKTITSSSGERKRLTWNYHLKDGADVNMFGHDHCVPCVPQPTSFAGVKPSFLEWSEEVIAYLAVTDYQEFTPLLSATASKDVIEKDVMFKGILSENIETIDRITANQVKKEQDREKAQTENKAQEVQDLNKETKEIKEELEMLKSTLEQKKSTLLKADFFLRYLVHPASCDIRRPKCHGQKNHADVGFRFRRSHWTGDLASHVNSLCGFSEDENRVTPQADHVTGGVECREVKGCHSAVLSLAGTHPKARSSQFREDLRHCQDHPRSSECQRKSCSIPQCQYQRFYIMVSSSRTSGQLHQQCSSRRPQAHLSVRSVRERPRSIPSRRAKVKNQKDKKEKAQKGPQVFRIRRVLLSPKSLPN